MDKKKVVNIDMKQYGMFIVLIAVFIIFALMTGGKNLSPANINNLIMQNSYVVILATGMLLCVLTGNVDLGVGSVVALCGSVVGVLIIDSHVPAAVAIIAAILVGLLCGMFAGFFISVMGVPPFIVTLATMLMGRGATYTILKAQTKGPFDASYNFIGAGFLPKIAVGNFDLLCLIIAIVATVFIIFGEIKSIATKKKYGFAENPFYQIVIKDAVFIFLVWFVLIKLGQYSGFPFVLVIMACIVGVYSFITSKTVAGRQIYALGGNRKAAQLSGIKTDRVFFWVYTNMGFLAGVAGVVLSARNGSATPKAGDGFEMDAIASCYLGGAAVAGGAGTIFGAVIGAFIMGILNNGMSLYGWSTDIQKIVKGAVLLVAVTADLMSKRKKS
ncbi:MAG: sugar ABC transporter permease [Lachnospiraceae bacterium]|nr:sugar ABC transporter permease [Lachnospiraceae bacterium]MBQ3786433.1 sugar ABC transporter permease [Lachnospiraceae bacterium]MBQ7261156.1 sugar ABC transporter permease [Lachnospiraceae bacterium]